MSHHMQPALWELATMGEPMRPRGCVRRHHAERPLTWEGTPGHFVTIQPGDTMPSDAQVARWADEAASRNRARVRYFESDHAGADWPEDH